MRIIDLSCILDDETPVYPGDPPTELISHARIDAYGYAVSVLRTSLHAGTHIDGPQHMFEEAPVISEIPVERFHGRGVLIDARGKTPAGAELLAGVNIEPGDIVLVLTGQPQSGAPDSHGNEAACITEAFARILVVRKVGMLGIDCASPDAAPYPVHRLLLGNGILIAENLMHLASLIGCANFEVLALPVKIRAEAAPARVVALIR
ncbi:MAG TPA: cyclase family protein [Dissulfurispiraceae bacterium]|nr:cyclase family protein [Dissulfurispiraceae bacterium]